MSKEGKESIATFRVKCKAAKGVYIGPLYTDQGPDEMAKNVFRLLYSLGVKCADIVQITVSTMEGYARVLVKSSEVEDYLVCIFKDACSVMNQFDLRRVTHDPTCLTATRISEQEEVREKNLSQQEACGNGELSCSLKRMGIACSHDTSGTTACQSNCPDTASNSSSLSSDQSLERIDSEAEDKRPKVGRVSNAATSTTDLPRTHKHRKVSASSEVSTKALLEEFGRSSKVGKPESKNCHTQKSRGSANRNRSAERKRPNTTVAEKRQRPSKSPGQSQTNSEASSPSHSSKALAQAPHNIVKLHVKTSTPAVESCGCPETIFYNLHQHIGTETRHAEFKRGGIVREQAAFRATVGKYVCGFLNSEGGTLYFGVSDDGQVLGIPAEAAVEEMLRGDVDFAVRSSIEPPVDAAEYSVNFARVVDSSLRNSQTCADLKVLEICVIPRHPPARGRRYSCNGVVYLRRDGSLQALTRNSLKPTIKV